MGFDLCGINPKNQNGEYFRNNAWWRFPLWHYVCLACHDILTPEQIQDGQFNDGVVIDARQAEAVADRLLSLIHSGHTKRSEDQYRALVNTLEHEKCSLCNGTGYDNTGTMCIVCSGKGTGSPLKYHPFDEENVRRFAEFAKSSGGFSIW